MGRHKKNASDVGNATAGAAKKPKSQCAKQVLRTTADTADWLSDKLCEKAVFVIDASVVAFVELPTPEQVRRVYEARIKTAERRGRQIVPPEGITATVDRYGTPPTPPAGPSAP